MAETSGRCFASMSIAVLAVALSFLPRPAKAALEIASTPTHNVTCSAGACSATAKKAVLNISDLANMLSSDDVTIASGNVAKDIVVKAKLSWVSASRLTLDSYRSISFEKPIVVAGTGAMTITTNDGGTDGDFAFSSKGHVEFWDASSSLVINGTSYMLVKSIHQIDQAVRRGPGVSVALMKNVRAPAHAYAQSPINANFEGNFEGLGNTISGLSIQATGSQSYVGFFRQYDTEGFPGNAIRDIGLTGVNISVTSSVQSIGALVGLMEFGTVKNAYATGTISSSGDNSAIGGLVGSNQLSAIENSHAGVDISNTGTGSLVGGLVGVAEDECTCDIISNSYATGSVSAGDNSSVGGLVGESVGNEFSNTYATGSVTGGNDSFVGGFVGTNMNPSPPQSIATILSSYSTGAVSGGTSATVGGFMGSDTAGTVSTDAYWNLDTSGVSDPSRGAGNIANDPGITGLTTTQFTSGLPAGFDPSVWKQNATINGGYPYLAGQPPN